MVRRLRVAELEMRGRRKQRQFGTVRVVLQGIGFQLGEAFPISKLPLVSSAFKQVFIIWIDTLTLVSADSIFNSNVTWISVDSLRYRKPGLNPSPQINEKFQHSSPVSVGKL
ncbi:MAG: hypothetical protein CFE39_05500 [Comamonadaceae bacterium PBBC2]|nr:MAG: hypothetical protein CFE39_05500 [Comamonadaceae bacterium PBBC2]